METRNYLLPIMRDERFIGWVPQLSGINDRFFSRGKRGIAGSMIFILYDQYLKGKNRDIITEIPKQINLNGFMSIGE